ncbi:ABCC5 [Bugula neritina]|uniref:ABCC5 n=1 Tax=Bugula neritina TaxID=10212 RepID=A0A7J7KQL0_BUGNE|nr:ABCC5 [Bugula neritina]
MKMIRVRLTVSIILTMFFSAFAILGPLVPLRKLTESLELDNRSSSYGYFIGMIIFLGVCHFAGRCLCAEAFVQVMASEGIRIKGGVLSLIFRKIIFNQSSQNRSVGELVNLCANDGQRLFEAAILGVFTIGSIGSLGGALYAIHLLGAWGILGFSVFFMFIPIQCAVTNNGNLMFVCFVIDIMMDEMIGILQIVLSCDEVPSKLDIRVREKNVLAKSLLIQSLSSGLPQLVPLFSSGLTFLAMTRTNHDLTVTQAFVFISLLNALRFTLGIMPYSMKALAEGRHACERVKAVLIAEDEKLELSALSDVQNFVEIKNGCFGWQPQPNSEKNSKKGNKDRNGKTGVALTNGSVKAAKKTESLELIETEVEPLTEKSDKSSDMIVTLHNINMSLKEGTLLGVCGAMKKQSGEIAINQTKKIAYVPQQAWIMNATVRENIVFGNEFDQERYEVVVEACALLSDFDQLPGGDQTEIGERGINLSGGQKQRISIARAVYGFFLSGCDYILVMKDGRIAEEGTHEGLMTENGEYSALIKTFHEIEEKERTIKEKDNLSVAADKADAALDSDSDFRGRAVSMSSMKNARNKAIDELSKGRSNNRLDHPVEEVFLSGSALNLSAVADDNENNNEDQTSKAKGKLTKAEAIEQGSVTASTYAGYISAAGGPCIAILVFGIIVLVGTLVNVTHDYNLTHKGEGNVTQEVSDSILLNPRINFYQIVYGCSLITASIFLVIKSHTYVRTALKASSGLHDNIFKKLVASPMRFFDVTPSGQIMNRFSKDLDEVDANLPFVSEQFINNAIVMVVTLCIIASVFPYFLLAMLPVLILFGVLFSICQKGIRAAKRIDNVTRSPLYSHIATTIQGLATIRAYKKEKQFIKQFNNLQDRNNMALFLFNSAMRWTAVRLDTLSLLVVFATSLFVTFVPSNVISPALAALALSYAMNMTGLFQYTMRLAIETEARFTSVERIHKYIKDLESEAPSIVDGNRPDGSWPKEGAIQFSNVNMRYREGLPLVLKNITLDIKPQEKIGVVGRTGSGKSSLAMVLFRMMELDGGSITIDGIDISTIGLEDLRSKLSIIPQDPVLFVGTVRYNLDPFNTYTDEELWSALAKCHIKDAIQALDGQLDATIVENGENFSVGERQLLCMARALLRHSKILVLDEATAAAMLCSTIFSSVIAIDTETDSLIQETIKEAFVDCTMLTIAHRLNTVVSADRVLVLDEGKVIEFDTPGSLRDNVNSAFAQMMIVQETQKHAAMDAGNDI